MDQSDAPDGKTVATSMEKTQGPLTTLTSPSLESGSSRDMYTHSQTKALLRKLDWNLIPFLSLLYLLSFLDRTNIGSARLLGLEAALGLQGLQYNTSLAIFFPFYVLAEIPSNLMLKKTRPSFWFAFIMFFWGLTMTCMGFVKSYSSLLGVRALLGLFEGGLFPGVTFYITMWYRRHECGLRMAIFFSAATAAGAFGGLLARGLTELDGKGNLDGWSWIFIVEGLVTVAVAGGAYWVINDYPKTATFLDPEEKEEVQRRLEMDRTGLADEFDMRYFFDAIKDWKIYVHMFITIGIYTPLYSFSLFLPTIVKNMGYTANESQLMSVPPYVTACLCTIGGGWLADRTRQRGVFMIFNCLLAMLGFAMLISTHNSHVQYAGTFLAAAGIYPNVPLGVAWNGNNIGGSTKRGVGIAMHVGFGNLGGIMAGYMYRKPDAPRYFVGHGTLIALVGMSCVLCTFMTVWLRNENKRRDSLMREKSLELESYTREMKAEERTMGDNATFFRYTI